MDSDPIRRPLHRAAVALASVFACLAGACALDPAAGSGNAPPGDGQLEEGEDAPPLLGRLPGGNLATRSYAYDAGACDPGDSDGDGTSDCEDECPSDPRKIYVGQCGCGVRDRDGDRDRLADCAETNTGVFLSQASTGSDPLRADTDGDGLSDGDEVFGTALGLDLPALGAHVLRKDIFIEYDWFDDANDLGSCPAHSHRPVDRVIAEVERAFADAPNRNADGTTGIRVHQDRGQGGPFTGGNLIPDEDGVISGGVLDGEFAELKRAHFDPRRRGYFHWVLLPHRYDDDSSSSGEAELPGDDVIVSLACFSISAWDVATTIVHELGHNLALNHGGADACNWKPSYPSVMNYKYQFTGVDLDCTPAGDRVISYSAGRRPALDERALDERAGMCVGGSPIDWNGNGQIERSVRYDLNRRGDGARDAIDNWGCDGTLQMLADHDDWSALDLAAIAPSRASAIRPQAVACESPPPPAARD